MSSYLYDSCGNLLQRVAIEPSPPAIIGQPARQDVGLGQTVTFSVLVLDAQGAKFRWRFNGAAIPGATGDSLVLTDVTAANAGQYSVVVTNSLGTVTSDPAALTVGTGGTGPTTFTLAAYGEQGGMATVEPMKADYSPGEVVTLTATTLGKAQFVEWAGDANGTANPTRLTMTGDRTVRARFAIPLPPPAGLVATWPGEVDGTDPVGGHDGVFFAGNTAVEPTIIAGKVGGAFAFDGTVHVRIPHSPALILPQLTVETWIFPLGHSRNSQTVAACGSSTGNDDAWWIGTFNGKLRFWSNHLLAASSKMDDLEAPPTIPERTWSHVAAAFDGTTKSLYVNGFLVAATTGHTPLVYDPMPIPVTIGSDWSANTSTDRFFGYVDETTLYNRSLTFDEIFAIHLADRSGKDLSRTYFTTSSPLAEAVRSVPFTRQLSAVLGAGTISMSQADDGLPPGVTMSSTGVVSGTTDIPGTYSFIVAATDSAGNSTEKRYALRVVTPFDPPS